MDISALYKDDAAEDIKIFIEKYIAISVLKEEVFKNDRAAYLVKFVSNDIQDRTRVDTSSAIDRPLQATAAFYDNKKSVIVNRKCEVLNLCFKREKKYYPKTFSVQFSSYNGSGYIKIMQYADEEDIQRVLQDVFENYG